MISFFPRPRKELSELLSVLAFSFHSHLHLLYLGVLGVSLLFAPTFASSSWHAYFTVHGISFPAHCIPRLYIKASRRCRCMGFIMFLSEMHDHLGTEEQEGNKT